MKRIFITLTAVLTLAGLSACTEKPQTGGGVTHDAAPYAGTGVTAFTAPGWKPGDKTSWEQELKTRGQYGQNDYTRTN